MMISDEIYYLGGLVISCFGLYINKKDLFTFLGFIRGKKKWKDFGPNSADNDDKFDFILLGILFCIVSFMLLIKTLIEDIF